MTVTIECSPPLASDVGSPVSFWVSFKNTGVLEVIMKFKVKVVTAFTLTLGGTPILGGHEYESGNITLPPNSQTAYNVEFYMPRTTAVIEIWAYRWGQKAV